MIRFTSAYQGYASGSRVGTFTPTQEAALIAAGVAVQDAGRLQDPAGFIGPVPRVICQFSIPCVIANSGTVATNGTVTLGTALTLTYSDGCWLYLPAGAIVGGSAGWYYAVMSSTTVGQVYTAYMATMQTPYIPALLTAATGSNSAYTGVTSQVTMGSVQIPAGLMGAQGSVRYKATFSYNNSAGAKTARVDFGGSTVLSVAPTTTVSISLDKTIHNRTAAKQVIQAAADAQTASSTAITTLAVDTSVDVTVGVTGQLATATDFLILEALRIELCPSP